MSSSPPCRPVWLSLLIAICVALAAWPAQAEQHSAKKGFGITTKTDQWKAKVAALNAGWFYSWGASLPEEPPAGTSFVPMIWGYYGGRTQGTLARLAEEKRAGKWQALLGFNEPDGKDQANLSVDKAIEAWPQLTATGLRLGSPAGIHADGAWMRDFMKRADEKGYRVDFITIHDYGGADAKGFLGRVEKVHTLYQRPIWITEFAVADWQASRSAGKPNRHSPESVRKFMRDVIPALERMPYVERYAWFSGAEDPNDPLGTAALFRADGSLTELGKIYAGF